MFFLREKLNKSNIDVTYDSWVFITINQMSWEGGPQRMIGSTNNDFPFLRCWTRDKLDD